MAKKKVVPFSKITTFGGFVIQFLQNEELVTRKACEVDPAIRHAIRQERWFRPWIRDRAPGATSRRCDPPPADHPCAGLKAIQTVVVLIKMPVFNETARWAA
jgi:hypothetical protein